MAEHQKQSLKVFSGTIIIFVVTVIYFAGGIPGSVAHNADDIKSLEKSIKESDKRFYKAVEALDKRFDNVEVQLGQIKVLLR